MVTIGTFVASDNDNGLLSTVTVIAVTNLITIAVL